MLTVAIILILVWLVVLVIALINLSKRRDIIVPVKIFWAAVIFFAPVVGLVLYFVFGFNNNNNRDIRQY